MGQENSVERWRIYSFQKEFERRCGLNSSLGPIENTGEDPNRKDTVKNIQSWEDRDNSSCSNVDHLFGVKDNENFISDDTFVVFDIENENRIFEKYESLNNANVMMMLLMMSQGGE